MFGLFVEKFRVGNWLKGIYGIGPILAGGLMSFIDIRIAKTASHIYRFAGLDPSIKWLGKKGAKSLVDEVMGDSKKVLPGHIFKLAELTNRHHTKIQAMMDNSTAKSDKERLIAAMAKRPYNQDFKTFCAFKLSESFSKFQNRDDCFYGQLLKMRKTQEVQKNETGQYKKLAAETLAQRKADKISVSKNDRDAYEDGKLPAGRLERRARRIAVKVFLSHVHHVMYEDYYNEKPPLPFTFARELADHRHYIPPPNWPNKDLPGLPLKDFYERT